MPIALITGANKGIGFATTRKLGEQGYAVWLACRDAERGEEAAGTLRQSGIDANVVILDVTDDESVRAAAAFVTDRVDRLDALVNNAGMHFGPPPPSTEEPVDQMRAIFDVNMFGPVRVTQAFLPLLRASDAARVVMVSSGIGSLGMTLDPRTEDWGVGFAGYSASKTALNMFTVKLATDLLSEGIKVNAADPGLTSTDLTGQAGDRSPDEAAEVVVALATLSAFGPTGGFFHEPPDGRSTGVPW